jgi:hypothetical protein
MGREAEGYRPKAEGKIEDGLHFSFVNSMIGSYGRIAISPALL